VPEQYQCTRTAYKTECRTETYTAYKCECVPETRTRVCTIYKQVPEMRTVTRCYSVCVPVVEERTVMQTKVVCTPYTTTVSKCVDRGHYECRMVPCEAKKKHHFCHKKKDCCDCCEPCCVAMKEVKVWVPCPTVEQCQVTCMKRECVQVPVTCRVCTYKQEVRQEQVQVCSYKCVPVQHTETYTCVSYRTVPFQATRTVAVCVPYQETYTATRMVARTVNREVSECGAPASCGASCGSSCGEASCCPTTCCKVKKKHCHKSKGCCDSCCY